jgi:hypothetical protein
LLIIVFVILFYSCIIYHILGRGKASRGKHQTDDDYYPVGPAAWSHHEDLSTHPDLTHHDLASLFLEGLPPLRKNSAQNEVAEKETNTILKSGDGGLGKIPETEKKPAHHLRSRKYSFDTF